MFKKGEIGRNLLGCFEVFLLMPSARLRFGTDFEGALRSFIVPILLFPLTLMAVYLSPNDALADHSKNTIALFYSLRLAISWALYLGCVYWIVKEVDRKEHFWQFVTAINWVSIPATLVFLPVAWMMLTGNHSGEQLYPLIMGLVFYGYGLTAFVATYILRLPWELAGFVAIIGFLINDCTGDMMMQIAGVAGGL